MITYPRTRPHMVSWTCPSINSSLRVFITTKTDGGLAFGICQHQWWTHWRNTVYETILQLLVTFRTSILFPVHLHIYETSMPIDDCDLGRLVLIHWGRVTHICVDNLTIIGSDNGLSPGRRQAITWTNVGILLIGPMGTNFSEMLIEIHTFSFENVVWKMAAIVFYREARLNASL